MISLRNADVNIPSLPITNLVMIHLFFLSTVRPAQFQAMPGLGLVGGSREAKGKEAQ